MVERCNQENWQDYEYKQCAGAMKIHDDYHKRQDSRLAALTEYIQRDRYSLKGLDWSANILNETDDINVALHMARQDFAELLARMKQ